MKKRNKFERKLDEYNHTMEFIRTISADCNFSFTSSNLGEVDLMITSFFIMMFTMMTIIILLRKVLS